MSHHPPSPLPQHVALSILLCQPFTSVGLGLTPSVPQADAYSSFHCHSDFGVTLALPAVIHLCGLCCRGLRPSLPSSNSCSSPCWRPTRGSLMV